MAFCLLMSSRVACLKAPLTVPELARLILLGRFVVDSQEKQVLALVPKDMFATILSHISRISLEPVSRILQAKRVEVSPLLNVHPVGFARSVSTENYDIGHCLSSYRAVSQLGLPIAVGYALRPERLF